MSVRRSASGEGTRLLSVSLARMNASIGFLVAPERSFAEAAGFFVASSVAEGVCGTVGENTGCNDQCFSGCRGASKEGADCVAGVMRRVAPNQATNIRRMES